mgnify:CR=1 FL=1
MNNNLEEKLDMKKLINLIRGKKNILSKKYWIAKIWRCIRIYIGLSSPKVPELLGKRNKASSKYSRRLGSISKIPIKIAK